MNGVIDFTRARKIRNISAVVDDFSDSLLASHRHLSEAKYKEQELNVLDNQKYVIENKMKCIAHQINVALYKASNAFCDSASQGCAGSLAALKRHFPETFKDFQKKRDENE